MNEVHSHGINGNVSRAERSDGGSTGVHSHEMDGNVRVVFERRGDAQGGSHGAAEGVNEDVNRLADLLSKHIVDIVTVEVGAADEAFEVEVILSGSHLCQ